MLRNRIFGKTGIKIPELGMGCWAIGGQGYGPTSDQESLAALETAWDGGVRFFDTADVYGDGHSEKLILQFIKSKPRGEVLIATKGGVDFYPAALWNPSGQTAATGNKKNFNPAYIRFACEQSLKRLGIDRIDLYQLHNPNFEMLKRTETFQTLIDLKKSGKIRFLGLSLHTTEEALWALDNLPVDSLQLIYNMLDQRMRFEVFPLAQKKNVAIIAREPLASGLLTGKYDVDVAFPKGDHRRRFSKEKLAADFEKIEKIGGLLHFPPVTSHQSQVTLPQAALQFALAGPAVSVVIPGVKTPAQIADHLKAVESPQLSPEKIQFIQHLFETDPLFKTHLLPA